MKVNYALQHGIHLHYYIPGYNESISGVIKNYYLRLTFSRYLCIFHLDIQQKKETPYVHLLLGDKMGWDLCIH